MSSFIVVNNAAFELNPNIRSIVIGNSQSECAVNDSIVKNLKNFSKSAEPYFYNYQKIKIILTHNKQIENVFIEFNPTNILIREDDKIWDTFYMKNHLPNYFSFMKLEDHVLLSSKNLLGYHKSTFKSLKLNLKKILQNNYDYPDAFGSYRYLKKEKLEVSIKHHDSIRSLNIGKIHLSEVDLLYLDKIILHCEQNQIKVHFIRSPYHYTFIDDNLESQFQTLRKEKYPDINFLDFKDFKLNNDEFADLQHLNYKGALKFSKWLNNKYIDTLKQKNSNSMY